MEVKPGYKQTDVGLVPEDWESTRVNNVASSARNAIVGGPFGSDLVSSDYVDDGVPVIRGQNMNSKWITGDFVFVTPKKAALLEANLARPGDIIFTQRGTLGQVSVAPDMPYERYLVSQSQMKLTLNQDIADPIFYYYLFSGEDQQDYIRQNTIQTGVPHINLGILRSIPIPRPPLPEQRTIAAALSNMDALIASLEKLIAKKRDIKQAAMQQLLTGKRRLPGFEQKAGVKQTEVGVIPGEWEAITIGDVVSFSGGTQPPRSTFVFAPKEGYIRLIQIRDYKTDEFATYVSESSTLKRCVARDVMIGRYGPPVFQILRGIEGAYNVALIKSIPSSEIDLKYWYYFVSQDRLFRLIDSLSRRSSGQTGVEMSALRSFGLPLPPLPEQRAVAAALSDMDTEIVALEARMEKTKLLKQGMMQELLTGRIRLV